MERKLIIWTTVVCVSVLIQKTNAATTLPTDPPTTITDKPTSSENSSTTPRSKNVERSAEQVYAFVNVADSMDVGSSSNKDSKESKSVSSSSSSGSSTGFVNSFSPSSSFSDNERTSINPAYFRPSDTSSNPVKVDPQSYLPSSLPNGKYSLSQEGWRPSTYWENGENMEPEHSDSGDRRTEVQFPDPSENIDVMSEANHPVPNFPAIEENEIPQRAPEPSWDHPPMFPAGWPSQQPPPRPQMDVQIRPGNFRQPADGTFPPFNNAWDPFQNQGNHNHRQSPPPPSREEMPPPPPPPPPHEQPPPPERPIHPPPRPQQQSHFPMPDMPKGEFPPRRSEFNSRPGPPQQFPHGPPQHFSSGPQQFSNRPPQRNPQFSGNPNMNNNMNMNNNGPPQPINAQRRVPMNNNQPGPNFGNSNLPPAAMGQSASFGRQPNNFPPGLMSNFPGHGNFGPGGSQMNFLPPNGNFRPNPQVMQQMPQGMHMPHGMNQGLFNKLAGFIRGRSLDLNDTDVANQSDDQQPEIETTPKEEVREETTTTEQPVVVVIGEPIMPRPPTNNGERRRRDTQSQFESRAQKTASKREDRPNNFFGFFNNMLRREDNKKKSKHSLGLKPLNQESAAFLNSYGGNSLIHQAQASGLIGGGGMPMDVSMMSQMGGPQGGVSASSGRPKSSRRNRNKGNSGGGLEATVIQALMAQQQQQPGQFGNSILVRPNSMFGGGGGDSGSGGLPAVAAFAQQGIGGNFGPSAFSSSHPASMNVFSQSSNMFPQSGSFAPQAAFASQAFPQSGGDSSFSGVNSNFFPQQQGASNSFSFQRESQNALFPSDTSQTDFFNPQ